ncbi:thermonuclease family protein [Patulibacter sp. NPDC049589]|uniref:thermonuclease family protein n=1 Tax=Patulibacter sp. NPDC049589 TaxID=3154731 RepID=UPI00344A3097
MTSDTRALRTALTASVVLATGAAGCGGDAVGDDPGAAAQARVTRVVDGDTVHVRTRSGDDETVRLALADAPESSTTRYGRTECGGTEAATFLRRLVDGRDVTLRRPGGEDHDRFGRSVAELALDGRSVDEQLVVAGWAKPFRVPAADGGAAANRRIRRVADRARDDDAGVWRLCGGFGRGGR